MPYHNFVHISQIKLRFRNAPHQMTTSSGRCFKRGGPFNECKYSARSPRRSAKSYLTQKKKNMKNPALYAPGRATLKQRRLRLTCPDKQDRFQPVAGHRHHEPQPEREPRASSASRNNNDVRATRSAVPVLGDLDIVPACAKASRDSL